MDPRHMIPEDVIVRCCVIWENSHFVGETPVQQLYGVYDFRHIAYSMLYAERQGYIERRPDIAPEISDTFKYVATDKGRKLAKLPAKKPNAS